MERAYLATIDLNERSGFSVEDLKSELKELALSSGLGVAGEIIIRREEPTPDLYIGKGKAEELRLEIESSNAGCLIISEDLSFTQQRNLEDIVGIKVIDRTQLILDIFAQRAKSSEGKVQVELAQLSYIAPRLAGKGIMLSRLGGGIGTRGPGEQKLEVDRRRIRKRITKLKEELLHITNSRSLKRKERLEKSISTVALIGYTNAGKSTLLNALTGARAVSKDQLFSTLDPITRRTKLSNNQKVLFVDTVGFLHKLPHHLVESFKATLEEVVEADLLVHVLDASSQLLEEKSEAVYEVLSLLKAKDKPIITALNKIDKLDGDNAIRRYLSKFENAVAVSAKSGAGLECLLEEIEGKLRGDFIEMKLFLPQGELKRLNLIYKEGNVLKKEFKNEGVYLKVELPAKLKSTFDRFEIIGKIA